MIAKLILATAFFSMSYGEVFTFEKENSGKTKFAFASYYQDHMVLQMEPYAATLWGYGSIGAKVEVVLENEKYPTAVLANSKNLGVWKVTLKPQSAGGPFTLSATQNDNGTFNKIMLKDILFGDVWVCSGQSNMQFTVSMVFNATEELQKSFNYPDIRIMTASEAMSDTPLDDLNSIELPWSLPSPASLGGTTAFTYFSAVCWFYGKYLYDNIKVPIGLVSSTWGGTPVECWSSPAALEKCNLENQLWFNLDSETPVNNSVLWNAMIHPFLNMTIKGAIWYQGEANAKYHTSEYSCSFPAMIEDWREKWFESTTGLTHRQFPFGFVQLSTRSGYDDASFPLIRWHQTGDYGYVPNPKMPNTFMAVAMDLGDPSSPYDEIHPRDKQDVGLRLGLGGLQVAYGKHVNPQGPYPIKAVRTGDGHVVVTYGNEQQLVVTENGNFQVCCSYSACLIEDPSPSSDWLWAPIMSHTHSSITLQAQVCTTGGGLPVLLRYAWALVPCDFKTCSVYNDLGLPGPPFVMAVIDM